MTYTISIPQSVKTFNATYEQNALARRYAIRVTSLGGTLKLMSRACKCGLVQEYEFDTVDTPRNRWEAQHNIERLEGDDWRCAVCNMSHLVKDTASSGGGNGNGGRARSHRNRQSKNGDARVSRKQIEARIKQLADMIANPGQTPDEVIAQWQAEQDALAATLVSYSRKRRVA